jgi:uncharacterized membrane protein YdcZ (DUF606 family)
MNRAYRLSLACGIVPLVAGVGIFLAWVVTRQDWLMTAGMITLVAGFIAFCVGAVALGRFCWLAIRKEHIPRTKVWSKARWSAGLLVVNFPVAAAIIVGVIAIETRYTVRIINDLSQPLHEVRVYGGGVDRRFGTMEPGTTRRQGFWIQQDGELTLEMKLGPTLVQTNIDGYVTQNLGGDVRVTVNADSSITIKRRSE